VNVQGWMTNQISSDLTLFLLCDLPQREISQEFIYRVTAKLTVLKKKT